MVDFATQALLVLLGFALIFSPSILVDNVDFGVAPTWSAFFLAIPVAMIAYTGIETISNLAEEARDPSRDIPRSIRLVAIAVYAIYFTLPAVALSALPVSLGPDGYTTPLGLPPEDGGFANDPVLGLVENLGIEGVTLDALKIYVGVLAATILLIAANAGVIGASRITYAMASYRQLPAPFRRLHPRFKTPVLALILFAGVFSIIALLPGQTDFLGTMYSFGAMLSFTVAHVSIVALRIRRRDEELVYRARPNLRWRGIDWPLFAIVGGLATGPGLAGRRGRGSAHAVRRDRLDRAGLRRLRRLPARRAQDPDGADRARAGAGAGAGPADRVPLHRGARDALGRLRGGAAHRGASRRPSGGRASPSCTCCRSRWSCPSRLTCPPRSASPTPSWTTPGPWSSRTASAPSPASSAPAARVRRSWPTPAPARPSSW